MLDSETYLIQEIQSATPAKLRWLLLRKGVGLCEMVRQFAENGQANKATEWLIQVQDILNELLSGVTDPSHPVAVPISDLYVFLIKQTYRLIERYDAKSLQEIKEVLEIEMGTWESFVQRETSLGHGEGKSPQRESIPHFLENADGGNSNHSDWLGLNLEA